jgi:hypothetical protein
MTDPTSRQRGRPNKNDQTGTWGGGGSLVKSPRLGATPRLTDRRRNVSLTLILVAVVSLHKTEQRVIRMFGVANKHIPTFYTSKYKPTQTHICTSV